MIMKHILFFVLLILSSCGNVGSKSKTQGQEGTVIFISPIFEQKLDSLMAYVDILEDFDLTYCTIKVEPKDSIGLLTVLISDGSIARLYKSPDTLDKQKDILSFYGGFAVKTNTNSIIMIDSLSYDYIKAYIKNDAFSSTLYEHGIRNLSHRIPYRWTFEINTDSGDLKAHPISPL